MTSSCTRPGPRPRTAWRDRVRVLADASGVSVEGLGELVEAELTRTEGVLFTATPAEELDEISRWGRLADAAWCGQVRAIVAAHNRMTGAEREFLGCEVALALNLSDGSAQDLVATALLTACAPGLLESVEAGMLTVRGTSTRCWGRWRAPGCRRRSRPRSSRSRWPGMRGRPRRSSGSSSRSWC